MLFAVLVLLLHRYLGTYSLLDDFALFTYTVFYARCLYFPVFFCFLYLHGFTTLE